MERAQRRSTKLLQGISHLDYNERDYIKNIPSDSFRRNRADLILVYKLLNNHVPEPRKEELKKGKTNDLSEGTSPQAQKGLIP